MPRNLPEINRVYICRRVNASEVNIKSFENYPYLEDGAEKSGKVYRYALDVPVGKTSGYSLLLLTKFDESAKINDFFSEASNKIKLRVMDIDELGLSPVLTEITYGDQNATT